MFIRGEKMIKEVLKSKLKNMGYTDDVIDKKLEELDFNLITSNNDITEKDIEIIEYNTPNVNIERNFLNVDGKYLQAALIEGDIEIKSVQIPTGSRLTLMDFALDKRLGMVLVDTNMSVEIVLYNPDSNTKFKYNNQKYEFVYGKDREIIINEYLEALTANNRLMLNKAREVVNVLANDFVIDEMIVNNINPVFKVTILV